VQLREHQSEMENLNLDAAVVTFEADWLARAYAAESQMPWPILLDAGRALYHAYGMYRARWWNLVKPKAVRLYVKLMLRGARVRLPTNDVRQLGGDVIIDPSGNVRMHWVAEGPAARPSIAQLLDTVRAAPG
jgi:peroxiredoxin